MYGEKLFIRFCKLSHCALRYHGSMTATVSFSLPTVWSTRAIKSFAMAKLEARKLKYPNTGTEALLMGILVEEYRCFLLMILLELRRVGLLDNEKASLSDQLSLISERNDCDSSPILGSSSSLSSKDLEMEVVELRRVNKQLQMQIRSVSLKLSSVESQSNSSEVDERAASTAFGQVCEPYHSWAVRTAVSVGMYTLLNREQLLQKLNETDGSSLKCLGGLIARH